MKKSPKQYLSRNQALSKEGFATQLERNIADLKEQCAYEIDRLQKAQKEANRLEEERRIFEANKAIFESNKEMVERRFNTQILDIKAQRESIKKEWAEIQRNKNQAEELLRKAQARIETAEAIENRIKDKR